MFQECSYLAPTYVNKPSSSPQLERVIFFPRDLFPSIHDDPTAISPGIVLPVVLMIVAQSKFSSWCEWDMFRRYWTVCKDAIEYIVCQFISRVASSWPVSWQSWLDVTDVMQRASMHYHVHCWGRTDKTRFDQIQIRFKDDHCKSSISPGCHEKCHEPMSLKTDWLYWLHLTELNCQCACGQHCCKRSIAWEWNINDR